MLRYIFCLKQDNDWHKKAVELDNRAQDVLSTVTVTAMQLHNEKLESCAAAEKPRGADC